MDDQSISEVVAEIEPLLIGRAPGKIFQLGPLTFVIDFRLRDLGYLLISVEPSQPRLHLLKRRVRDLEKQSMPLNQFCLALRKALSNRTLLSVEKDADDRIVRFRFVGTDEVGNTHEHLLIAQLSGHSANLFLADRVGVITLRARSTRVPGQEIGKPY